MIAVDEVHIGMPGRAEQHRIARGFSDGSMCGRIIGAEVSFDFNDASGKEFAAFAADENFAQQIGSNKARIAVVKRTGKDFDSGRGHLELEILFGFAARLRFAREKVADAYPGLKSMHYERAAC